MGIQKRTMGLGAATLAAAVYDLSLYEKAALEKRGIDVILTRERNQDPGLYERGQMAVKKGHGYANVLFESNHTDAFNGKACGVTD